MKYYTTFNLSLNVIAIRHHSRHMSVQRYRCDSTLLSYKLTGYFWYILVHPTAWQVMVQISERLHDHPILRYNKGTNEEDHVLFTISLSASKSGNRLCTSSQHYPLQESRVTIDICILPVQEMASHYLAKGSIIASS